MSILFKNAKIITKEKGSLVCLDNAYLVVQGNTIKYIGKERQEGCDEEKDMSNHILLPGFVNDHTHTAMVLMRGLGSGLPLQKWLERMWAIEDKMKEEDIRVGMELALLEMIRGGTTSFSDMYLLPFSVVDIIGESGIKANIAKCLTCFNPDQDYKTFKEALDSKRLFDEYNNSYDERLKIDFSIHAEYTINENIVRHYSEDALKRGARISLHLSETAKETRECILKYGKTPAKWFADLGVFNNRVVAAHCVHLTDDDISILKNNNVTVAHNPTSNLKLGSGVAPVPRLIKEGVNVSLGTDGAASNNNLNMMEEMHIASIIHNGVEENPTALQSSDAILMATENGAISQGRFNTGVLEVGKRADIIALSLSSPHSHPVLDPIALVTYALEESDVTLNMVDGKILYEDGEYKTLDKERIYRDVEKRVAYLYSNN